MTDSPITYEQRRERAHRVAEAAMRDIAEMLAAIGEPPEQGYDLIDQPDGSILILCGHDVRLMVDAAGDEGPA